MTCQRNVHFRTFLILMVLAAASAVLTFAGCSQPQAPTKPGSTDQSKAAPQQAVTLKVGTLPIVDTLPLHVADTEGFFARQNVKVELVPFASAVERDAAIASGQLDGQLNDLVSVGLLNKDGQKVKAVRVAHRASPQLAQFGVLVGPQSLARSVADLKGSDIAISKNTVIEYVTDEFLAANGLKEGDVKLTEVSKIPVRLEMLMKGQVGAATMPEPFIALALKQGARVIANDAASQLGQSVISFRSEVLSKNPGAVRSFLAAYEQAVTAISASPEKYRALLVDRAKLPDAVKDTFPIPRYPEASVPKEAEVEKTIKWMVGKGLLPKPISYGELVDSSLLPK